MKKILSHSSLFSISTIGVLTAAILCGCGNQHDDRLELELISYDTVAHLSQPEEEVKDTPGSDLARLSGEAVIPIAGKSEPLQLLRDSLIRLADMEVDGSKVIPVSSPDFPEIKISDENQNVEPCNLRSNNLSMVRLTPKIAVWEEMASSYLCKAAHGITSYSYVNFSISEKKILALSDIFMPGYEEQLTMLVREQLSDRQGLLVELDKIELPDQFRITSEGVEFVYNVYQIAPYAAGAIRVEIPVSSLEGLLAPLGKSLF